MKTYLKSILLLTLLAVICSSCGVMFGGSRYNGTIIAKDHPNAEILINDSKIGNGKGTGMYYRNEKLTVKVKEEGCEPKTQTFNRAFRTGNFILSIISWGLIGLGVDLATGACYKPDHKHDPAIQRISDKEYIFTVDYSGCPPKASK